ncbi:amidohydrolase family protein [uncultured Hoeflea sp.]|uniref:amidohydrolase family protein n=1 Tax=uncultured Hoeflea sp. TaxID=538666 RepID=UPI0030DC58A6
MKVDLVLRNARVHGFDDLIDIAVTGGIVTALGPKIVCEPASEEDLGGKVAFPGFVDSHVHLDKACILDRCRICAGTLQEAVRETAAAKAGFTEDDVYARASIVVEKAILHGTTQMRSFVEVDPRAGMRSFRAIRRIKADYAFALDIQICAFAQDGLTQEAETLDLLDQALSDGADLVGGCPYTDPDPARHVSLIFDMAEKHGVDVDFHLDFDLDPTSSNLPAVISETEARGYQSRVTVGHMTKLSAMPREQLEHLISNLHEAGIALVTLPSTDLFLMGREHDHTVPRGVAPAHLFAQAGVTAAIATNNVLNPFTPYGDASLARMANLYANVMQLSLDDELSTVFSMVSDAPARILQAAYGLKPGGPADIVVLDATDPVSAIREIAAPLCGWKAGRKSFSRPAPLLHRPVDG